jgi:mannobiose 2-epimerase
MEKITAIKTELIDEIRQRILPFWFKFSTDHENCGFYGRVDNRGKAVPDAPKSLIL